MERQLVVQNIWRPRESTLITWLCLPLEQKPSSKDQASLRKAITFERKFGGLMKVVTEVAVEDLLKHFMEMHRTPTMLTKWESRTG